MDPADVVYSLYDAFSRGDYESVVRHLHPDVQSHLELPGSTTETHEGVTEIRRLLGERFGPRVKGADTAVQDVIVEDGGRVTARVRFAAGGEGGVVLNAMHIFQFRDARIVEMWFQPLDDEAALDFWRALDEDGPPA